MPGRRKAVCREIEKTMNTFKVNGARMSLCHMRAELGGHNEQQQTATEFI